MNKIWSAKLTVTAPMLLALVIVLVGLLAITNVPAARAQGADRLAAIPPVNLQINAKYVNSIQASKVPAANQLLPLNASKQFPLSAIPQNWTTTKSPGLKVLNPSTSGLTIGVLGVTNSSTNQSAGVFGFANAFTGKTTGVQGWSNSPQGAGVQAGGVTTALSISNGGIQVQGAGKGTNTTAFIQVATVANVSSNNTKIDNPMTNGHPNLILIVTPNYDPGGTGGVSPSTSGVGVYYDGANWQIFNVNTATPMVVGSYFNVLVIQP